MKGDHPAEGNRRTKFRPQVSLLTFLLLVALFAVSLVCWRTGNSIERLQSQLVGLRDVARELKVDDPAQFAVVKKIGQWFGDTIFEIHVPADQPYQLCLALDAIDREGFSDPLRFVSLPSGEHRLEICYDTEGDESVVRVLVDDQTVIEEARPKDWEPRAGHSIGTSFLQSTQCPVDEPLVLCRRRFCVRTSPTATKSPTTPGPGILVWVEPDVSGEKSQESK